MTITFTKSNKSEALGDSELCGDLMHCMASLTAWHVMSFSIPLAYPFQPDQSRSRLAQCMALNVPALTTCIQPPQSCQSAQGRLCDAENRNQKKSCSQLCKRITVHAQWCAYQSISRRILRMTVIRHCVSLEAKDRPRK